MSPLNGLCAYMHSRYPSACPAFHKVEEHSKKLADRSEARYIVGYVLSSRMYRVLVNDSASSIMRFRIVRHLYVTADNHREYHSRSAPPFKLKGFPCMRNVTTCADPLSSAVISSVRLCNSVVPPHTTIYSCGVYASPIPPAGVYVQSISTKSPITGSQSALAAGDSNRKRSRASPIIIQDAESIQEEGTKSPPDRRRLGDAYRRHYRNQSDEYPGRHRKPVRFYQPQFAPSISKLSIEPINAALVDSNHAAGTIPKDRQVNNTESTWRDSFMGKHSPAFNCFEVDDCGAHSVLSVLTDTPSVKNALSGDDASEWRASMHNELQSIFSNDVLELNDPPDNCNILGSKWVLKYKRNSLDEIERRKSRIVAQGFSQKPGIDFTELYSPTGNQSTSRMVSLYAARHDLGTRHVDIKCACLQGDLHAVIYMRQPPILKDASKQVWKLKKPIYGLKQAPRQWHHKLIDVFVLLGYVQAKNDPALFVNHTTGVMILVWVDDLIIIAPHHLIKSLVKDILERFEGRDLGEA
jgi:hypothetical protein